MSGIIWDSRVDDGGEVIPLRFGSSAETELVPPPVSPKKASKTEANAVAEAAGIRLLFDENGLTIWRMIVQSRVVCGLPWLMACLIVAYAKLQHESVVDRKFDRDAIAGW
jgi:hypothetical protein